MLSEALHLHGEGQLHRVSTTWLFPFIGGTALVLDGVRRLPVKPRSTLAVLAVFVLLLGPLYLTTDHVGGDYCNTLHSYYIISLIIITNFVAIL